MKTAVSVPDDVFQAIDELARRQGRSRSSVYTAALRIYLARHNSESITEAIDRVVDDVGDGFDPGLERASLEILRSVEW
ncbi:MAG: ribbon-helix-helix protein, CopG family [Candidatus Limnocylindrales bacterium]|jgi:metal-responsive CopG/Arc/MetJ family transcriptional regulator